MKNLLNQLFIYPLIVIFFYFPSLLKSEIQVGSWESILSHHKIIKAQNDKNGNSIILTDGGIVIYDLNFQNYQFIEINEVLLKIRFMSLHIDEYNLIWLGGESPNGIIQVVSKESNSISNTFNFNLQNIFEIVSDSLNTFAIYLNQNETGILHFIRNQDEWEYKDYYNSFPINVNNIIDIKINNGEIILSTNSGILKGNLTENLKLMTAWNVISDNTNVIGLINDLDIGFYTNTQVYVFNENNVEVLFLPEIGLNPIEINFFDGKYHIINSTNYIILNPDGSIFTNYLNSFSSNFINILDKNLVAVEFHGIYNIEQNKLFPLPNTPLESEFSAITILENGDLAAIGKKGLSIMKNDKWFNLFPSTLEHYFNSENFNNYQIDYSLASGADGSIFPSWSIIESKENSILFANSGILPNTTIENAAIIEVDINNFQLAYYDTTDGVIGGLNGIYNHEWLSSYMVINQIKTDENGNIWLLNPYEENNNNIIAIRPFQSEEWFHISAPDEYSFLPTELDFDSFGRAWVGFEYRQSMNQQMYSSGGLKVVRIIDGFSDDFNYVWSDVSNSEILPNENIWSVTVDDQDFVWVLTSQGIQGYSFIFSISGIELSAIYPINFYSGIPFYLGDHIRSDSQNTKWISTRHSGVKTILETTQLWPNIDGFTANNSDLLSDIVYDLYLDEENGYAWFATDLGISKLNMPIKKKTHLISELQFSPNPFIIKQQQHIVIEGCIPGATVIIHSSSGRYINTLNANYENQPSTQVIWDGRDYNGNLVDSGVYIASSRSVDKKSKLGKFAIIR